MDKSDPSAQTLIYLAGLGVVDSLSEPRSPRQPHAGPSEQSWLRRQLNRLLRR